MEHTASSIGRQHQVCIMSRCEVSPSGGRTLGGALRLETVTVRGVEAPGSAGAGLAAALTESVACSA